MEQPTGPVYYYVVGTTASVLDGPSTAATVLAMLERGDIIQALQVVAAESTGLPDGNSAVQFA